MSIFVFWWRQGNKCMITRIHEFIHCQLRSRPTQSMPFKTNQTRIEKQKRFVTKLEPLQPNRDLSFRDFSYNSYLQTIMVVVRVQVPITIFCHLTHTHTHTHNHLGTSYTRHCNTSKQNYELRRWQYPFWFLSCELDKFFFQSYYFALSWLIAL